MQYKRKKLNLQVKKRFQMWLLTRILGTVLLSSIIAAIILYFYSSQEVGNSFYDAHIKIRKVSDLLIPVILAGTFVSLFSGTLLALFLPQKLAGPVFRIEEDLKIIQAGNIDKEIKLREEDPLKELADTINDTISYLRSKIK
ncbi:MAG: methyl-accepting chemotaxis protein [Proteobacteria bacterium]|nr:methyl-accepting chemotaxis protein [Pseudomonadota bacterium]MBU1716877.1 methyl-accepting chemotaxis protein [Pseudomonadota bacterium]